MDETFLQSPIPILNHLRLHIDLWNDTQAQTYQGLYLFSSVLDLDAY